MTTANQYLPIVAWKTMISDVVMLTSSTYRVTVSPLDITEPGATLPILVGFYLKDFLGYTYRVSAINVGGMITNIELTDDFVLGWGPQQGRIGVIYESVDLGTSPYLSPAKHKILDLTALDYSRAFELDILWRNRYQYWSITPNALTPININSLTQVQYLDTSSITWTITQVNASLITVSAAGVLPTVTNDITTNSTFYPLFTNATSGVYAAKVSSTKFNYNPYSGSLGLSGDISSANMSATQWVNCQNIGVGGGSGIGQIAMSTSTYISIGGNAGTVGQALMINALGYPSWGTVASGGSISLTTTGISGAATLVSGVLNIPNYLSGGSISLTTTGTSGAATLSGGVLNIPNYTSSGSGMTWPSAAGIAYYTGSSSWGALTIGAGLTLIGTTLAATGSGGSMVYPAGSGIPVVSAGTSWTTTIPIGTAGQILTVNSGATGYIWAAPSSASMVYPGAGLPISTGSAWGTSFTTTGNALKSIRVNSAATAFEWYSAIPAAGIAISNGSIWTTPISIVSGNIVADAYTITATEFTLVSDIRKKINVKNISTDELLINYKEFEMITAVGHKRYGVVAQELIKTNPEFVSGNDVRGYSVNYIDLLIREIAYLKCEIKKLQH